MPRKWQRSTSTVPVQYMGSVSLGAMFRTSASQRALIAQAHPETRLNIGADGPARGELYSLCLGPAENRSPRRGATRTHLAIALPGFRSPKNSFSRCFWDSQIFPNPESTGIGGQRGLQARERARGGASSPGIRRKSVPLTWRAEAELVVTLPWLARLRSDVVW